LQKEKAPPFPAWPLPQLTLLYEFTSELDRAFKLAFALATLLVRILLAGLLALTARILLLLSWLLAAALLLARLLSGILVLLARVRILVSHHDLPFSKSLPSNFGRRTWLPELWFQIRPLDFQKSLVLTQPGRATEKQLCTSL
jgi:hypothetical protein